MREPCLCGCGEITVWGKYKRGHYRKTPEWKEISAKAKTTHGMTGTRVHTTWVNIRQRCHNPNVAHYERYGGRGITVCDRWRESFENFYADMGDPPEGTEIDRIKNEKGYEPGNCEWVTRSKNNRHRRSTRWIEVEGRKVSMAEASELTGIPYSTLKDRISKNKDPLKGDRNGRVRPPKI